MTQIENSKKKDVFSLSESENSFIGLIKGLENQRIKIRLNSDQKFFEDQKFFVNHFSNEEVYRLLESLSSKKILEKIVLASLITCPNCGETKSTSILICPKCGSAQIGIRENIRHIKCGYIGPKEKYYEGISIRCPNCYEIISKSISGEEEHFNIESHFECNTCGERISKDDFELVCLKCKQKYEKADAVETTIITYELSSSDVSKDFIKANNKRTLKKEIQPRVIKPVKPRIKRIKKSKYKTIENVKTILGNGKKRIN
jgi:hypothetical protein